MKNIVMLMILVICTPSYLSNPYLTAKLIEVRSLKSTILGILCIIIMIRRYTTCFCYLNSRNTLYVVYIDSIHKL